MHESLLLLSLLAVTIALGALAKRFELPYPIVFVIGGAALALVPGLPQIELNPELLFLVVLPPLLYAGGWTTDWTAFRRNLRPIGLLAIGLVIVTTVAVAYVAHALTPELGWASAFALGAIVSPPDAVAAEAVFERFKVPRRVLVILTGEGLVNDATALVIYRFAIVAALTGAFSLANAAVSFVVVALGGIAIGLAIGAGIVAFGKLLDKHNLSDALLDNLTILVAPYAAYLAAEALHVSGVLSAVVAGIFVSRKSSQIYSPDTRLTGIAIWQMMIFVFNALVFLLIGLELRAIVHSPSFALHYLWTGIAISLLAIAVRIAWVFPATYLPRLFSARVRRGDPPPPWQWVFVISWSGMRGIVSLAAALALPFDRAGRPFPGRDEIVFVTFCVIFATLVLQGITLIPIVRRLGLGDMEQLEQRERDVRIAALRAGLARLHALEPEFDSVEEWEVQGRTVAEYEYRIEHLLGHADGKHGESAQSRIDHRLQTEALHAERRAITHLRNAGEIPDEIFRKIEYDLDLADSRLA
jgi:CPA1 family monovalent cation:H+ antiporter